MYALTQPRPLREQLREGINRREEVKWLYKVYSSVWEYSALFIFKASINDPPCLNVHVQTTKLKRYTTADFYFGLHF